MLPGIQNTLSAVKAYTRGAAVRAGNVANLETRGAETFETLDTVQMSGASRGVEAVVRENKKAAGGPDVGNEAVETVLGERAFQASVAAIRASDKTLGVLLDTVA